MIIIIPRDAWYIYKKNPEKGKSPCCKVKASEVAVRIDQFVVLLSLHPLGMCGHFLGTKVQKMVDFQNFHA